ncbi:MAG: site-specific integrase [Lachnospiraceae bacterium]|nr:site-specific integrase [Lachnospiraceae bacterium]
MAKGSVRKKGKKWYYRFYIEDASGNLIQKECVGTESKSETEKLLRQAMDDYESKRFVAKSGKITLGELLEIWADEDLKTGSLSNGTVSLYLHTISRIKKHPIGGRRLDTISPEHLQAFFDLLTLGGTEGDFHVGEDYNREYAHTYSAVLNHAFRFAVFPKKFITFNPMQYVVMHKKQIRADLFESDDDTEKTQPLTTQMYDQLIDYLNEHHPDGVLPIQIAYYAGLRIGEVAGLTWSDINLDEQYLTVRRSVSYNPQCHMHEIGPTKRSKVRVVDFGDKLSDIFRKARIQQKKNRIKYGSLYQHCYYKEVHEKTRTYYDYYHFDATADVPEDYKEIDFVCRRECGELVRASTIGMICKCVSKKLPGFEGFHFHVQRHTYTTNLLVQGAQPKDVQELLGHSDVSTTMNIYAHATRESKKASAKLLDGMTG